MADIPDTGAQVATLLARVNTAICLDGHEGRQYRSFRDLPGSLFRDCLSRAAKIPRKVFEFRQPVPHQQDGLRIVNVDLRGEFQIRNRRGVDVHQAEGWMVGHEVAATSGAILPFAIGCLGKPTEEFLALGNFYTLRIPKGKGIDRTDRPRAARTAMAISHHLWRTGRFHRDPTK